MNVLYIVGGEGNRYGSEIIAISLLSAGSKSGINYTVITAKKGAVSKACEELNIKCYITPFTFFVYKALNNKVLNLIKKAIWRVRAEYLTWNASKVIEKAIDMKSIDLIHTNLTRDLLGGILSHKYDIPHIWHIQELYKAHYQLSFLRNNQIEWMSQRASQFLAISKTVADEWIENGLPKDKVKVIYNGVDLSNIEPKQNERNDETIRLVMVGHLVPAKGQIHVIEQLSMLPSQVKTHIVFDCFGEGTEEYKNTLSKKAKEFQVMLNLRGYCSDLGKKLKEYDIGINYSCGEGFGLSTVEYMAAGLCTVVANTGANTEIIRNGENGYTFNFADKKAFKELIEYLFFHKEQRNIVASRAMEEARELYSIDRMQKEVYEQYKKLVRRVKEAHDEED